MFVPNPVTNRASRSPGCQTSSYGHTRYDGLNQRIVKQTAYSEGSPQDTYDYYHNANWQVVEERKDADTDPVAQYVWHPYYIDAPAVRWYDADTDGVLNEDNDGQQFYTHDANFNVTCLMDNGGTALERYHYTPYGKVTIYTGDWSSTRSSSLYANPYLYTGREYDAETGLYHYRHRYYHAELGRFVSRDPIEYDGGDPNLYRYVFNNPTNAFDPSGLAKKGGWWPKFKWWCKSWFVTCADPSGATHCLEIGCKIVGPTKVAAAKKNGLNWRR